MWVVGKAPWREGRDIPASEPLCSPPARSMRRLVGWDKPSAAKLALMHCDKKRHSLNQEDKPIERPGKSSCNSTSTAQRL
ncbi:hypothetical protein J1614_003556 [Plenodomus biglobosus]|nr:hypothetical protein J1614_003556 [Plenodomus biglobosus]